MASVCISNCVNGTHLIPNIRPLTTFVSLHKWPESDVEFVMKRMNSRVEGGVVVDSISCRQIYLRSYKFSREKEGGVTNKAIKKCFRRIKESVVGAAIASTKKNLNLKGGNYRIFGKVKVVTYAAFFSTLHRLLACSSSKVNVAHHD